MIEVFCLEPHEPAEFTESLSSSGPVEWKCLVGNLKRWKQGTLESRFVHNNSEQTLNAERTGAEGDSFIVRFTWTGSGYFICRSA